ncbi:hypothetical protein BLAT2472_20557 [Burkholderia latens]
MPRGREAGAHLASRKHRSRRYRDEPHTTICMGGAHGADAGCTSVERGSRQDRARAGRGRGDRTGPQRVRQDRRPAHDDPRLSCRVPVDAAGQRVVAAGRQAGGRVLGARPDAIAARHPDRDGLYRRRRDPASRRAGIGRDHGRDAMVRDGHRVVHRRRPTAARCAGAGARAARRLAAAVRRAALAAHEERAGHGRISARRGRTRTADRQAARCRLHVPHARFSRNGCACDARGGTVRAMARSADRRRDAEAADADRRNGGLDVGALLDRELTGEPAARQPERSMLVQRAAPAAYQGAKHDTCS